MNQRTHAGQTALVSNGRTSDLDNDTRHVLTLSRLLMEEFTNPGRQAWVAALMYAEERLADRGGARLAYGVLAAVQALRQCRPVSFSFRHAACPSCSLSISPDEALLCAAFAAAHDNDRIALSRNLSLLAYGPDHAGLDVILQHLAQDFAGATRPAARAPAL